MAKARKKTSRPPRAGHEFIEGTLSAPLLEFDLKAEMKQLRQEAPWRDTGRNAKTLVKHPDFRIVLIVMKAKTHMREHKAAGRISVQTLTGNVRLHLPAKSVAVAAGHLLALDRAMPHDVEALNQSAFLLTISWPEESEGKTGK